MKMHFVDYQAPGSPDVLFWNEGNAPVPKAHEMLIQVKAAGVNRPDLFQRAGDYPPPQDASPILGLEVAGLVAWVGSDVKGWNVGDAVCALTNGGGYAEYCAVPHSQCLPIPEGLDFIQGASLPETYFTVWSNVFQRGRLTSGEKFLVHAGASGIGTAAIQLSKAFGAQVFTTVSSLEKKAFCQSIGADYVILYKSEDFEAKILELTQAKGVHLILDMVGGGYFSKNLKLLSEEGRLVQISFLQGNDVALDLSLMMRRRLTITGSTLRPQSLENKSKIAEDLKTRVWPLFAQGRLKTAVAKVFPMREAAKAHRLLESGAVSGKIVLDSAQ